MKPIYLDHNATTPLRPEARDRWLQVAEKTAGNPSSLHGSGRRARGVIDRAREQVAAALGAHEDEIYFTSGGTESNNWALRGCLGHAPALGSLLTTEIEHSSVFMTAKALQSQGAKVDFLGVDKAAQPDLEMLRERLASGPCDLVSVMTANNEVGSLMDLQGIAELIQRSPSPTLFHTDAVQALGKIPVKLCAWGVDLASFSAHKVGGPMGVGVLWKRKGIPLPALLHGGGQENELRPGTENIAGIAAAALAIELAVIEQPSYEQRVRSLLRQLWSDLQANIPHIRCYGPSPASDEALPNTLCVQLDNTDGKVLITQLDLEGLEASAGSACASGSSEPSHVLSAMGHSGLEARAGLRLSLGRTTSEQDCKRTARLLTKLFGPSHAR